MRKIKLGVFERKQLQETIAREIYQELGYNLTDKFPKDYMAASGHPTEIACYRAAGKVLERFIKIE